MINELLINYLILFIALEIYEVSWQKSTTVMGMLVRMYEKYSKSVFVFLIMHPTFYFSIWFAMVTDYNPNALILLFMKSVDLATKILLIEKVFRDKVLSEDLARALLAPINSFIPYIGLLIYPILILTI